MINSQIKQQSPFKNYYEILQIPQTASSYDIQNAYLRLSTTWHPDNFRQNKRQAENRYNDVCQAYQTLSNKIKRQNYDDFFNQQYSLDDATKNFDRFYQQYGVEDQQQKRFFQKNFPDKKKHFYDVLEIPKNATYDQIKKAYRRLAIKYHPKNNPGNQQARKKFIQLNRALNSLLGSTKRSNFNDFEFRQLAPIRQTHSRIVDDIWKDKDRIFDKPFQQDQYFSSPLRSNYYDRRIDRFIDDRQFRDPNWIDRNFRDHRDLRDLRDFRDRDNWRGVNTGESIRQSTITTNDNGRQTRKSIKTRKVVENGIPNTTTTEQHLFPDGTREIRKIKDDGRGNVTTDVYNLKRGENLPIGL